MHNIRIHTVSATCMRFSHDSHGCHFSHWFFLYFFVLFYYFLGTTLVSVDIMSWWSTSCKTVGFVNSGLKLV